MEFDRTNTRRLLRRGRASLLWQADLPCGEGCDSAVFQAIAELYQNSAQALERWAERVLLPSMDEELASAPRKGRLHYVTPKLQYSCAETLTGDRWLWVTAIVALERGEGLTRHRDDRVWDLHSGRLCPIEWFLPRREAARYLRWSFGLDGDAVWAFPRKDGKKQPIRVGKPNYLAPPS